MNFGLVDDKEFERICKDVLEIMTHNELRFFGRGPDGGIDIKKADGGNEIVGQCKHYIKTSFTKLLKVLRDGLQQAIDLHPSKYYLFISADLTRDQVDTIFNLYKPLMPDAKHVICGSVLEDLLNSPEYEGVVRKHLPLFIANQNVLRSLLFNDISEESQTLLTEISDESAVYSKTEWFAEAAKILADQRLILITGNPGVGKTTLSKMLIMEFLRQHQDAHFVYSAKADISALEKAACHDGNKLELFFMDDFLGSYIMDLGTNKMNQITSFIENIRQHHNRYLIINSRVAVLRRTQEKYTGLERKLIKTGRILLEIESLSQLTKADIFIKHIVHEGLDQERIDSLLENNRYLTIVGNANYNPRVIEFVTTKTHYEAMDAAHYYDFVMNALANPTTIWQDEYEKLSIFEQNVLFALETMPWHLATDNMLEECTKGLFHKLGNANGPTTESFPTALSRLNGSFLKRTVTYEQVAVNTFANPPVEELVRARLRDSYGQTSLSEAVCYVDQLFYIYKDYPKTRAFKEQYENGTLFSLKNYMVTTNDLCFLYFSKYDKGGIVNLVAAIQSIRHRYLTSRIQYTSIKYSDCLVGIKNNPMVWNELVAWLKNNPLKMPEVLSRFMLALTEEETMEIMKATKDANPDVFQDPSKYLATFIDAAVDSVDLDSTIDQALSSGIETGQIADTVMEELEDHVLADPLVSAWRALFVEDLDDYSFDNAIEDIRCDVEQSVNDRLAEEIGESFEADEADAVDRSANQTDLIIKMFEQLRP